MKRLAIAGIFGIAALTASAVSYRGFFDIMGGVAFGDKTEYVGYDFVVTDLGSTFGFGFNTSHGCQILPNLYVGAGAGIYTVANKGKAKGLPVLDYGESLPSQYYGNIDTSDMETQRDLDGVTIPVFVDVRWDLDVRKKVTPFVDLKVGYQFGINTGNPVCEEYGYGFASPDIYDTTESGFYVMPTVGVRFRQGKTRGFNLGICYNPCVHKRMYYTDGFSQEGEIDIKRVTDGLLMLALSFDF
jgi:hypothetical protein